MAQTTRLVSFGPVFIPGDVGVGVSQDDESSCSDELKNETL